MQKALKSGLINLSQGIWRILKQCFVKNKTFDMLSIYAGQSVGW